MKTLTHLFMGILVTALILGFTTQAVMAQEKAKAEKAKAAPAKETKAPGANVLFENERVRVTESRQKPGAKNEMQMRNDRVVVPLKAAKTRTHYPDGKTEDIEYKVGGAVFRKKGVDQIENIGKTEGHTVIVTLK